jgi:hypothetical protein
MIGYVTIGTNDFERAAKFYDALFAEFGAKRTMQMDRFIAWGTSPTTPMVSIIKPFDGKPASVGNGVMVALLASSEEQVNRVLHGLRRSERGGAFRRPAPASAPASA